MAFAANARAAHLVTLFHGTSSELVGSIRRVGLIGDDAPICLASTAEEAALWAQMRVDNLAWRKLPAGDPVVVAVKVPVESVSPKAMDGHYESDGPICASQIVGIERVSSKRREMDYTANAPWVQKTLNQNLPAIVKRVDDGWLPGEREDVSTKKKKVFVEYGCGHYGCVLPTYDFERVLKITSDPLEAWFVAAAIKFGEFPQGIVRYDAIYQLDGELRGRKLYAIWRQEAYDVGGLSGWARQADEYTKRGVRVLERSLTSFKWWAHDFLMTFQRAKDKDQAWADLKRYEDWAWKNITLEEAEKCEWQDVREIQGRYKGGQRLAADLRACEIIAEMMANDSPVSINLGEALTFYMEHGILLADVHLGNIGTVNHPDYEDRIWTITDPGHAVPTQASGDKAIIEHI